MPEKKSQKELEGSNDAALPAGMDLLAGGLHRTARHGHCPLVAIGGSAGSLEVLQEFFHALPASTGLSFVVVLHLSPTTPSALPELLQHWTRLRVCAARHMQPVQADHVYVIPTGRYLTCRSGYLQLGLRNANVPRRLTIDMFLRSLAESYGREAAAIVLSGADKDGSMGIQYVKEAGGLTLVQDPTSAKYPVMPQSAISTGCVDAILPVCDMPLRVMQHFSRLPGSKDRAVLDLSQREDTAAHGLLAGALEEALRLIRERIGQDFAPYRRPMLLRRLAHRIEMSGADSTSQYLSLLRESPEETDVLRQDFLISVTDFFRDPDHFAALARTIPELFHGKGQDDVVRVWVPGCATGEEAYSIGMLLLECAEQSSSRAGLQVFGTDLDAAAIMAARTGHYPQEIDAHLTAGRLQRFFAKDLSGYQARRELREPLLFAVHDILKDAPFAHMDLVSCRNLLIYLTGEAQREVLETLHFSLRPGGLLFLGSAEGADARLFSSLDAAHQLYRREPGGGTVRRSAAKDLLARSQDLNLAMPTNATSACLPAMSPGQGKQPNSASRGRNSAVLRANNQELFVINQELRAATEELDINRQELQCINEELTVLNQQLGLSIDELSRVNSDLKNFIDAADLGIIFLDRTLKIMRYTPVATRLFRLIPTDLGRPLADLRHNLRYDRFESDVRAALTEALETEREVVDQQGQWFLTRIMPYRTLDMQVAGVMLTFVDVTERKLAEAALRSSEAKYRTLFNSIDEGYALVELIYNEEGRVTDFVHLEVNPAEHKLTGLGGLTRKTNELTPVDCYWLELYARVAGSGLPERVEWCSDGMDRWFSVHVSRVGGDGSRLISTIFDDITERKRRDAHQALLAAIADDLSERLLPEEIMDTVGWRLGAYLKAPSCTFVDVDDARGEVTVYQGWPHQHRTHRYQTFRMSDYFTEELTRTNRAGEACVVRHTGPDHCATPEDAGAPVEIGSLLDVPFRREGRWIASLAVTDTAPREWREDEIQLVRDVADRVFPRLERARAEQDLSITEERMRSQKEAFQAAIDGASLETCLHLLAGLVAQETAGKARTSFYMIDRDGRCLHPVYGAGDMPHSYLKQVDGFLIGESPLACGLADETGRPVVTRDVFEEPLWKPWLHLAEAYDFRGCWSFPIKTREKKAVGKLVMMFQEACEAEARDHSLADIVTQSAAVIISNHLDAKERNRAEEALRESEERLRAFLAATSNIVYVMNADWSLMRSLIGKDVLASMERPRGDWMDAYIPEDDRPLVRQTIEQAIRNKTVFELRHRVIRMDGTVGQVSSRAVPIMDRHGDIVEWFGTADDISHMRHARQAGPTRRTQRTVRTGQGADLSDGE